MTVNATLAPVQDITLRSRSHRNVPARHFGHAAPSSAHDATSCAARHFRHATRGFSESTFVAPPQARQRCGTSLPTQRARLS